MTDNSGNGAIAVIGMEGRFPGADSVDEFWKNVISGVDSITFFSDEELRAAGVPEKDLRDPNYVRAAPIITGADQLDAALFGISPREAQVLDPQHRVFLETCHAALQQAGYDPGLFGGRISLYAGARNNEYVEQNLRRSPDTMRAVGEMAALISNHTDYLATGVAYRLGLRGPALSVVTACSTSLVAVHLACQALRLGDCEIALAGGVEIALPVPRGYFYSEGGIFSPDGRVRPFDAKAHGTVFGSGCGVVVLRRLADAQADGDTIQAVILGAATNNDGAARTAFSAPSESGQAAAITAALRDASVSPASIGMVEAHGTGTAIGDPIEVAALRQSYDWAHDQGHGADADRGRERALGSVKANVGHLGAAAGICGLIKAICCVRDGQQPPSLNFGEPNPRIDFGRFRVLTQGRSWPADDTPRRAGVSSFGIGGTNAHVIIEQPPAPRPDGAGRRSLQLLTLSAHTTSALDAAGQELSTYLDTTREPIADVAFTLNLSRSGGQARRAVVSRDIAGAIARLTTQGAAQAASIVPRGARRRLAFLFPGQGAQYPGMARGLYQDEPAFAATLDWCAGLLAQSHRIDLLSALFPAPDDPEAAGRLAQTAVTQPALFSVEYALAKLLEEQGVMPDVMVGHSVGEYVAAVLAGVLDPADALRLVAERGALVQALPGGSMLAVMLPEHILVPLLPPELDLAAVNAPGACVVSGSGEHVRALRDLLALQGVASRPLETSHAFHSRMMDPALDEFRALVRKTEFAPPRARYLSNVTGTWITSDDVADPEYWVRHLRGCVRFSDELRPLVADGGYVFAEIGPGRSLSGLVRPHAAVANQADHVNQGNLANRAVRGPAVVPVMQTAADLAEDSEVLLDAVGKIWMAGAPVNWARFWAGERRRRVPLPRYPYERKRFWIEPETAGPATAEDAVDDDGPFFVPAWQETAILEADVSGDELWVVLAADGEPVLQGVISRLRASGAEVLVIGPADEFAALSGRHYQVRRVDREDYARVLDDVAAARPARVRFLHGWGIGRPSSWRRALDDGFFSALTLLQEIARRMAGVPADVTVITTQMQDVTGDGQVDPVKSAVLGLVRVAPKEMDRVTCRSIDLDTGVSAAQVYREIISATPDSVVALRGRKRWRWSHTPVKIQAAGGVPAVLKERGVYLISGGLGGLGLELARQLGELVRARLVLVSRSGVPDRSEWAALGDSDPVIRRIRGIEAAERAGAEVLICAGDVTDEPRMREIRSEAERVFGPIEGIFHLAGVAGGGMLEARSRADAEQVLGPKVAGTYILDEVFRPDLFVLYSSVAAITGDYGLGDYAGANAVLDAFAQSRWADGRRVVSVNWAPWSGAGMAHDIHGPALLGELATGKSELSAVSGGAGSPVVALRAPGPRGAGRPAHPLLLARLEPADGGVAAFEVVTEPSRWVFADHLIDGRPAMSATGIVELACAAYREVSGEIAAEIRDLTFSRPLVAEPGLKAVLTLSARSDGGYHLRLTGRTGEGQEAEYARGHLHAAEGTASKQDLAAVRAECDRDTTALPFHSDTVRLGPRWRNISARLSGPGLDLVTVRVPAEFADDCAEYILHPAALDSAGAIGMTVLCEGTYLPFSYDVIAVRGPLPARFHSIIRYIGDTGNDIVRADITVVDDAGGELVAIRGLTMLRTSGMPAPATVAATPAWQPGKMQPGEMQPGEIQPAVGAELLRIVLASGVGPQVIACPGGIARMEARARRVNRAAVAERLGAQGTDDIAARSVSTPFAPPGTDAERTIVQLWQRAIGIDMVGIDDDFLEIGGNSLVAVQVASQITQHFRIQVPVAHILESRTVRSLAAVVADAMSTAGAESTTGQVK